MFERRGFTLVEIIIVMSLIGFLFFIMFGAYFRIQDLIYNQSISSQEGDQAIYVYQMLSNDLNNLSYETWNEKSYFKGEKDILNTGGRADKIYFISKSLYSNSSTMQTKSFAVSYFSKYDDTTQKNHLFRRENPFPDPEKMNSGIPVPVLNNITELKFRYSRNGQIWLDEWDSKISKEAPRVIQAQIKWIEGEDKERTQEIFVKPYAVIQ